VIICSIIVTAGVLSLHAAVTAEVSVGVCPSL